MHLYTAGSNIINVQTTDSIPLGAYVSSVRISDADIERIEIISDTQVRVSAQALASSAYLPAGAGPGITYLSGTQSGSFNTTNSNWCCYSSEPYNIPPGSGLNHSTYL